MQITKPEMLEGMIQALSDGYSRRILLSAIPRAKSVEDLSRENEIPLSTCYRRVNEMTQQGIMIVEKITVTPDGKKYEMVRSAFKSVRISFDQGELVIDALPNEDIADKLNRMWVSMRG